MKTVDAYIAERPANVRKILVKLRELVKANAPDAVERFAYGMPGYRLKKRPLVYFGAFKTHIGFYPTPSGIEKFQVELAAFPQSRGAVRFPLGKPIPYGLLARIVQFRVEECLAQPDLEA